MAGADVLALRVNYVGELGWELHARTDEQLALYDALMAAGAEHGLRDVGMYAMESMRLEKSYRAWKGDLDHELSPLAAGLGRFVDPDKAAAFVGKAALAAERERGPATAFVTLELEAADGDGGGAEVDALYGCALFAGDERVGLVTSGGYGHRLGRSLALGYAAPARAVPGTALEVELFGARRAARVVAESPYDPENARPRG